MNAVVQAELMSESGPSYGLATFDNLELLVAEHDKDVATIKQVHDMLSGMNKEMLTIYLEASSRHNFYGRIDERNLETALAVIKKNHWRNLFSKSKLADYLPSTRIKDFNETLEDPKKLPEFTYETIRSTLTEWAAASSGFFTEKVDAIFKALSPKHLTNSPKGFGNKMILNGVSSWYSSSSYRIEAFHDLRSVVATIYKMPSPELHDTKQILLNAMNQSGVKMTVDQGAFEIRAYPKSETVHLFVHEDVAITLNMELAKIYPAAIPPQFRTRVKTKAYKEFVYQTTGAHPDTIRQISRMVSTMNGKRSHHFFKGDFSNELKDILRFVGAIEHETTFEVPFELKSALTQVLADHGIPDIKSHQHYATPDAIAQDIADYLAAADETTAILEPSGGRGHIAKHFKHCNLKVVEVNALFCEIMRSQGIDFVLNSDFLKCSKSDLGVFDYVVMNPPYSEGRLLMHIQKAVDFVKIGGEIIAVVPTGSVRGLQEKLGEKLGVKIDVQKTYEKAFEDTAISTALVVIRL